MKRRFYKVATWLPLIVIVALGIRLGFAWNQERKIPRDLVGLVPFMQETGNIAFSIALGQGFGSPYWQETGPTAWLTPVYPYIVAGAYRVFGIHTPHAFFAMVLLNILFSAATCIPIFYVGKRVGGLGVASIAAWLWAVFPNAWIIPYEWIWDTSLSALLMATILWATLWLVDGDGARASDGDSRRDGSLGTRYASWRGWGAYGVLWGFALMTNPSMGVMLPFSIGWAVYRSWSRGQLDERVRLLRPALAAAIAILCCVPWTVRNYLVFHRFIPLRSNFALELWLGNNENFDPQSQVVPPSNPERAEIHNYIHMGETAFMQDKWRQAIRFIRSHPRLEVILFARRFVAIWTGLENPVEGFRDSDSLMTRVALASNFLAGIGALCGIVVLFLRRSPYAFFLPAFPIVFPAVYYVTHASLRYRQPIDPVVMLLIAVAICSAGDRRNLQNE
jgi:4-amino-4-deoxy-L-arabinose transferase-like glycosyltransferase